MANEGVQRKLIAILSADAVGYSRLMSEDEVATVQRIKTYRELISVRVKEHRGRVVDSPGDNLLAEFPSALDAVRCGVEIQGMLKTRNDDLPDDQRMQFRIGIHLGDVMVDGERIYGDGVNIAARLEELSDPGGICISATVHEQVQHKLNLDCEDIGEQKVKNIPDTVRTLRILLAKPEAPPVKERVVIPSEKPSIAVLPFDNMSGDPNQEYFADGMTEEIITRLSMNSMLTVLARNSTFFYKGKQVKLRQISEELGARYVVEGSVRKAGNMVRITAQLIDAAADGHIWVRTYDREYKDVLLLQDEVAHQIVVSMGADGIDIAEQERVKRKPIENLTAYDLVLQGRNQANQRAKDANAKARELYEKAIELDPDYSTPYAFLSDTYIAEFHSTWGTDTQALQKALEYARKAVSLDHAYYLSHVTLALAYISSGQISQASAEVEKAISLNPNDDSAYYAKGTVLEGIGRYAEAAESIRTAIDLNPHYGDHYTGRLSWIYRNTGQFDQDRECLNKAVARNPHWQEGYENLAYNYLHSWSTQQNNDPQALDKAHEMAEKAIELDEKSFGSHWVLSLIYMNKKMHDRAVAKVDGMAEIESIPSFWQLMVYNYAGRSEELLGSVEEEMEYTAGNNRYALWALGHAYSLMDRHHDAVATLRQIFTSSVPNYIVSHGTHVELIILYIELGYDEEGAREARRLLELVPNFSVDVWGERVPYKDPAQAERDMADLRKAGLK